MGPRSSVSILISHRGREERRGAAPGGRRGMGHSPGTQEASSPEPLEGADAWPPEPGGNTLLCFEPPGCGGGCAARGHAHTLSLPRVLTSRPLRAGAEPRGQGPAQLAGRAPESPAGSQPSQQTGFRKSEQSHRECQPHPFTGCLTRFQCPVPRTQSPRGHPRRSRPRPVLPQKGEYSTGEQGPLPLGIEDRKSTRLNSSH